MVIGAVGFITLGFLPPGVRFSRFPRSFCGLDDGFFEVILATFLSDIGLLVGAPLLIDPLVGVSFGLLLDTH